MYAFRLVGLMSTYKEGRLTLGAVRTLEQAELDDLLVFDGPAGDPLDHPEVEESLFPPQVKVTHGRWRTDARKRQAMLEEAQRRHALSRENGLPLFGLILDGDEILGNGWAVRDICQWLLWQGQADGEPFARYPLITIERDGSMSFAGGRLVRLDMIRRYHVSNSVVENVHGVVDGYGNLDAASKVLFEQMSLALDHGRLVAWPPWPGEPFIYHRSHLRHPARAGNRLHRQEATELARYMEKEKETA